MNRPERPRPLTAREREVLALIAQGYTNRGIAVALGISLHTVKHHVTNILAALDVGSRLQATLVGLRTGIIPQQDG